ncbi:hypothetical protein ThidrDRAFT_4103 [Thiorhodococcus drewsii AZ1]|uniref:Uncharacterized protein n=1 Tax=Thiorhodococcus drewsii AZ1 TaxID=765913 RepID=G2E740_9GAMM|nr:hypothetical protein [Thiorhodococcus drewsii]EGV28071.1 hypothetical protein ThidrDRAFT_4103 [Thiorhodococcus drewsii AZ1]
MKPTSSFTDPRVILTRPGDPRLARYYHPQAVGVEQSADGPTFIVVGHGRPLIDERGTTELSIPLTADELALVRHAAGDDIEGWISRAIREGLAELFNGEPDQTEVLRRVQTLADTWTSGVIDERLWEAVSLAMARTGCPELDDQEDDS